MPGLSVSRAVKVKPPLLTFQSGAWIRPGTVDRQGTGRIAWRGDLGREPEGGGQPLLHHPPGAPGIGSIRTAARGLTIAALRPLGSASGISNKSPPADSRIR